IGVDGLVADREPAGGGAAAPAALEWQARGRRSWARAWCGACCALPTGPTEDEQRKPRLTQIPRSRHQCHPSFRSRCGLNDQKPSPSRYMPAPSAIAAVLPGDTGRADHTKRVPSVAARPNIATGITAPVGRAHARPGPNRRAETNAREVQYSSPATSCEAPCGPPATCVISTMTSAASTVNVAATATVRARGRPALIA